MASVSSLGYLVASATDLDAWHAFAVDLLGIQLVERSSDRLLLRVDDRAWRIDVRKSDTDRIDVIGWEVPGAADLEEFAQVLSAAGYPVTRAEPDEVAERQVSGLVRFQDATGTNVELFFGQRKAATAFVSSTGARFITGELGLGHAMQFVDDSEEHRRLYVDLLGFRLSDYIEVGPEPGTFLHCNPRHHSMAFAHVPGFEPRLGHLMLQVEDLDTVGRAYDRVLDGAAVLGSSLGRHTNDEMLSFYVKSPSQWEVELGHGGLLIDDATWLPVRWDTPHYWGHKREKSSFS